MKNSLENISNRRDWIVDYINRSKTASVNCLAKQLSVSEMTIRRDLRFLMEQNLIAKTPTGMYRSNQDVVIFSNYYERNNINQNEKRSIARLAMQFVNNGDFIAMDSSTTVIEMVKCFPLNLNITLVTNSLAIPLLILDQSLVQLICTGGSARPGHASSTGSITNNVISMYKYDKAFISANAFDPNLGLCDKADEMQLKSLMAKNSKKVYFLCDSSKFLKKSWYFTAIQNLEAIITDSKVSPEILNILREKGYNVLVAPDD